MTTSASIEITGLEATVLLYQWTDGYPSYVLPRIVARLQYNGWRSDTVGLITTNTYSNAVATGGSCVTPDLGTLDDGEDADWVYLINLESKSLTVQFRKDTGSQDPVNPLLELEGILPEYQEEVRETIEQALASFNTEGFTLALPN